MHDWPITVQSSTTREFHNLVLMSNNSLEVRMYEFKNAKNAVPELELFPTKKQCPKGYLYLAQLVSPLKETC